MVKLESEAKNSCAHGVIMYECISKECNDILLCENCVQEHLTHTVIRSDLSIQSIICRRIKKIRCEPEVKCCLDEIRKSNMDEEVKDIIFRHFLNKETKEILDRVWYKICQSNYKEELINILNSEIQIVRNIDNCFCPKGNQMLLVIILDGFDL